MDVIFDEDVISGIQGESHGTLFFLEVFLDVFRRLVVFFVGEVVNLISHTIFFGDFVVVFFSWGFRSIDCFTDFLETELP